MSVQVKRRRDIATNVAPYVGAQGELIVDTTNNRVVVQDGATAGGFPAAKLSEVVTNTRTAVSDLAYTVLATDRLVAYTALTAARVVTLPAASAYPVGTTLTIIDESGGCTATNRLNVTPNGLDKIEGVNALTAITQPYGTIALESNGLASPNGKWTLIDQSSGMMATQPITFAPNGAGMQMQTIEQLVTLATGTTVNAAVPVPANCILFGVSTRVVTAVTGAPSFNVGTAGSATLFGGSLGVAAGGTNFGLIGPTPEYATVTLVVASTGAAFTGGTIRLAIHILVLQPSQS